MAIVTWLCTWKKKKNQWTVFLKRMCLLLVNLSIKLTLKRNWITSWWQKVIWCAFLNTLNCGDIRGWGDGSVSRSSCCTSLRTWVQFPSAHTEVWYHCIHQSPEHWALMLRGTGRDRRTRITRDCWLVNITGTGEGDSKLWVLYLIGVAKRCQVWGQLL